MTDTANQAEPRRLWTRRLVFAGWVLLAWLILLVTWVALYTVVLNIFVLLGTLPGVVMGATWQGLTTPFLGALAAGLLLLRLTRSHVRFSRAVWWACVVHIAFSLGVLIVSGLSGSLTFTYAALLTPLAVPAGVCMALVLAYFWFGVSVGYGRRAEQALQPDASASVHDAGE